MGRRARRRRRSGLHGRTWDPRSWDSFVAAVRAGDQPSDLHALIERGLVVPVGGGQHIALPVTLDGMALTHVLTAADLAADMVAAEPDLCPLQDPVLASVGVAGGGRITFASRDAVEDAGLPEIPALRFPDGVLADSEPGDVLVVQLIAGRLRVGTLPERPGIDEGLAARLAEATRRMLGWIAGPAPALSVREAVWSLLVDDPDALLDGAAPLGDLFVVAGLHCRGSYVAEQGVDLSVYAEPRGGAGVDVRDVVASARLSTAHADALRRLDRAVVRWRIGAEPPWGDEAVELCMALRTIDPGLLLVVRGHEPALAELAAHLVETPDAPAAVLHGLRAAAHDWRGEVPAAERALRLAAAAPKPPAQVSELRAELAELRGHARAAARHLRAAGEGPDSCEVLELGAYARAGAGPLAPWVWRKAAAWLHGIPRLRPLRRVAQRLFVAADPQTMGDPVVTDVALFEHGLFERFLAERGSCLPAAERALATGWADAPPRLYRVRAGPQWPLLPLEDVESGAATAAEHPRGQFLGVEGDLVFGRLLPDGHHPRMLSPGGWYVTADAEGAFRALARTGVRGPALTDRLAGLVRYRVADAPLRP